MAKQKSIHEKLTELASNYWWSWEPEVTNIFRGIDPVRWSALAHNPVLLLEEYTPDRLEQRARELVLHSSINRAYRRWLEYMDSDETWGDTHAGVLGQSDPVTRRLHFPSFPPVMVPSEHRCSFPLGRCAQRRRIAHE